MNASALWALLAGAALTLAVLALGNRPRRPVRPRRFDAAPIPVAVRAVFDRRGELWFREDDTGTYWTNRGLRCHLHELLASRGPLTETWVRQAGEHR